MATITKMVLNWNDFETNAPNTFRNLWKDDNFTDVTLAAEDDQQIRVHKVILSSCSPFFQNILLKNPHPLPLLYLKDIQYRELELLVQFIYLGHCEVGQVGLEAFLLAGRQLKVKGLIEEVEGLQELNGLISNHGSTNQFDYIHEKTNQTDSKETILSEEKLESVVVEMTRKISTEVKPLDLGKSDNTLYEISEGDISKLVIDMSKENSQSIEEDDALKSKLEIPVKSQIFQCNSCSGTYQSKWHLKAHIESVHEGKRYPCEECGTTASSLGNLSLHKKSKHESIRYKCDQCSKEFTQRGSILRHKQVRHTEKKDIFKCDQCEHQEYLQDKLVKHKLHMHEGVWHRCVYCEFRANHAFKLKKHIQSKHSVLK